MLFFIWEKIPPHQVHCSLSKTVIKSLVAVWHNGFWDIFFPVFHVIRYSVHVSITADPISSTLRHTLNETLGFHSNYSDAILNTSVMVNLWYFLGIYFPHHYVVCNYFFQHVSLRANVCAEYVLSLNRVWSYCCSYKNIFWGIFSIFILYFVCHTS